MSLTQEIETLIQPALAESGFELLDLHYRRESGRWVLRLFIDRTASAKVSAAVLAGGSGVTLGDCEKVSELVGNLLDSSDLIADSYSLEVSSPGINRPLTKEAHFQRFVGDKVKISLYAPLTDGAIQKNFSGVLLGCQNQIVQIDDVVSGKVQIPIASIVKARLDLI